MHTFSLSGFRDLALNKLNLNRWCSWLSQPKRLPTPVITHAHTRVKVNSNKWHKFGCLQDRKIKVENKCGVFNETYTARNFCTEGRGNAVCLIYTGCFGHC